jgi:GT2 family glycosyltransferase
MTTSGCPCDAKTPASEAPVVWLVISSFRNDREIASTLEAIQSLPQRLFDRILVVDSLGTGEIPALIERRCWQNVIYRSYDRNLGSAGNLAERLRLAAEAGADFAYALNHDGCVQPEVVLSLLKHVRSFEPIGALYPLSRLESVGAYNLTGSREVPLPAKLVHDKPTDKIIEAFWSSSNGALYAMAPVRSGLLPWSELWMGWEDLEYGWSLTDHGYRQAIACDALFDDSYEYARHDSLAGSYRVVNKPAWMTYYLIRNLILVTRRRRLSVRFVAVVILRMFLECVTIILFRPSKWVRLRILARGVIDGLQNRTGKWILPADPVSTP